MTPSAPAATGLGARLWRGQAAFDALGAQWDELACAAGVDPLCNSHAWTSAFARACVPQDDLFGWTFETQGAPAAILALRREPSRGRFALRRALFLADGSFDSDYLAPPVLPGLEREFVRGLIAAAATQPGLHALVLAGMPDDSPFLAALRAELEARGTPRREHPEVALVAALPASLDDYLASLKPRMRSKVRSALRSAEELGARLAWCRSPAELGPWLDELFRLHGLRWRAAGQDGSFANAGRRAFFAEIAAGALARGELCLARLELDGVAVAVQFGVRIQSRYYQMQEGFDPAFERQRVGIALRALAMAELITDGVRWYDFMAGDAQHKRDWGGAARPCTTLAFPLPRWRALLAYRLRALFDSAARGS